MSSCSTSGTGCAIIEGQDKTIQWRKEKEQTAKCKTLHWKLRQNEPHLKPGVNSGVSTSRYTRGTGRAILVTNPVINHQRGKDRSLITTDGTYQWSCVTDIPND